MINDIIINSTCNLKYNIISISDIKIISYAVEANNTSPANGISMVAEFNVNYDTPHIVKSCGSWWIILFCRNQKYTCCHEQHFSNIKILQGYMTADKILDNLVTAFKYEKLQYHLKHDSLKDWHALYLYKTILYKIRCDFVVPQLIDQFICLTEVGASCGMEEWLSLIPTLEKYKEKHC